MHDTRLNDDLPRRREVYEARTEVERDVARGVTPLADRPIVIDDAIVEETPVVRRTVAGEAVYREPSLAARVVRTIEQVVDYAFLLAYLLLGIRLVLPLVGARPDAGFVLWINAFSEPLYAPFRNIVPSVTVNGGAELSLSVAFAIFVYAISHVMLKMLFGMVTKPRVLVRS
jgi:hypothetical protein